MNDRQIERLLEKGHSVDDIVNYGQTGRADVERVKVRYDLMRDKTLPALLRRQAD